MAFEEYRRLGRQGLPIERRVCNYGSLEFEVLPLPTAMQNIQFIPSNPKVRVPNFNEQLTITDSFIRVYNLNSCPTLIEQKLRVMFDSPKSRNTLAENINISLEDSIKLSKFPFRI